MRAGPLRWRFDSATAGSSVHDTATGQRLILCPECSLCRPRFADGAQESAVSELTFAADRITIGYETPNVRNHRTIIREVDDQLELHCEFTAGQDLQLVALDILPPQSFLNMYDVVNFRNHHFTPRTWPDLPLGSSFETGTFSEDWQFAPHPSLLVLRKNDIHLLIGAVDLAQGGFGMKFAVDRFALRHWFLDYGAGPHGRRIAAGETFRSPRLRVFLRHENDAHKLFEQFGQTLVRVGAIPDPGQRTYPDWWSEPLYCTWTDQQFISRAEVPVELEAQSAQPDIKPATVLDEALVRKAAAVIEKHRLPVRTILLDEGWHVTRGQWEPHPERFPDMRGLVDNLHDRGFKVLIWLAWPEIFDDAELPARFLAGGARGWTSPTGRRVVDYSSTVTQQDYLQPLARQLFSSENGCYDFDGFKSDFMADKMHPRTPLADPEWRGEENYLFRVIRLYHNAMRAHKPDALHMGGAGHYWLAPHIDLNRTYDVHTSNWREHEARGRMLRSTAPGTILSYDLHDDIENRKAYFRSAAREGAAIQLGNLLTMRDDPAAAPRPATAADYRQLRQELEEYIRLRRQNG